MANTEQDLLQLFADNTTNNITAAKLRQFVIDIYDQAVLIDNIVDDYTQTQGYNLALSAGRGADLNARLAAVEAAIVDLTARIEALEAP